MDKCCSQLSEAEIEALSCVIAEVNMLRANGSEESSIATEDALRYLRAAKYNSTRAIEIYKNYQRNRELYGLDEIKPYREPLNSEIASGKIQILGTSDHEESPILLFIGTRHDSKCSKLDAAMQLLFHVLDQISNNDTAQNNGIVFLLDLRECSQDPKYLRNVISVLLNGYPLMLKMIYIIGAPMWVKPILKTFRQLNKIKFVNLTELMQHFSEHQLPISLGGKFHPHNDHSFVPGSPLSPSHAPPRPKLPRQQSHPDHLCEIGQGAEVDKMIGQRHKYSGNLISVLDSRGRSHSGSAADRTHLRPLQPMIPPQSNSPPFTSGGHKVNHHQLKSKNWLHNRTVIEEHPTTHAKPIIPPQVVTGNASKSTDDSPLTSQATPTNLSGKAISSGGGVASRIQNFEQHTTDSVYNKGHSKSFVMPDGVKKPSRPMKALVQVGDKGSCVDRGDIGHRSEEQKKRLQWGGGDKRDRGVATGEQQRAREDEQRKKREEDMKRQRREEDRLQDERRKKGAHNNQIKKSLADDYENVDLGPPPATGSVGKSSETKSSPVSDSRRKHGVDDLSSSPVSDSRRKHGVDDPSSSGYENVAIHYTRQQQPPDSSKAAVSGHKVKQHGSSGGTGLHHKTHHRARKTKDKLPTASSSSSNSPAAAGGPSIKKHQYENITILTGPVPYLSNLSSSDDSEDFSGDESPAAPKEVIYENFGSDGGNQSMTAVELERHLTKKEKKGMSAEYLRIKNEPLAHPHITCKLKCNIPKNRYKDVVCYDNSRVVLETIPGIEGSDYIHANYVSSYKKPKAFILTQGPTKKTLVDFWRMVWEQGIHVVVMTTKCVELGRHKCSQYWPDEGVVKYGNVTVTVTKLQQYDGYELRMLSINCAGVERMISHFQFTAWPDYGVPTSGLAVLNLVSAVRETMNTTTKLTVSNGDEKIIVHCSAGVGRSGAYCVINNCIDEFNGKGTVNIQAAVRSLRLQRAYAIQTDEQYDFCYRTVLQYMKSHQRK